MSEATNAEQGHNPAEESRNVLVILATMFGMLAIWLWLLFDVIQPWVDSY
jgi:hypothetical protein